MLCQKFLAILSKDIVPTDLSDFTSTLSMVQLVKRLEPSAWRLLFYTFQKILAVGIGEYFSHLPQTNAPRHSDDALLQKLLMALRANYADGLAAGREPLTRL